MRGSGDYRGILNERKLAAPRRGRYILFNLAYHLPSGTFLLSNQVRERIRYSYERRLPVAGRGVRYLNFLAGLWRLNHLTVADIDSYVPRITERAIATGEENDVTRFCPAE